MRDPEDGLLRPQTEHASMYSSSRSRGVNLHHELPLWVGQSEDGRRGEAALEGLERLFRLRAPVESNPGRGQSVERSSDCAKAPDKPPIEISKP